MDPLAKRYCWFLGNYLTCKKLKRPKFDQMGQRHNFFHNIPTFLLCENARFTLTLCVIVRPVKRSMHIMWWWFFGNSVSLRIREAARFWDQMLVEKAPLITLSLELTSLKIFQILSVSTRSDEKCTKIQSCVHVSSWVDQYLKNWNHRRGRHVRYANPG